MGHVTGEIFFSKFQGLVCHLSGVTITLYHFRFLSYELHSVTKKYLFQFRTLTNLLGSPRFSVLRGHFFNLNKN